MNDQFMNISVMKNILHASRIGLWSIELDTGKEPRMYADEVYCEMMGMDIVMSPEEAYHFWYDRINEEHKEMVTSSMDKLLQGNHAEIQYLWNHPAKGDIYIRCGGRRDYKYKDGIRLHGTHQDISGIIQVQYDFIIRDSGIGMSDEFMEHIFEPFAREQTTTVSGIPGTGLGMAITKNIVDMMGGTICVTSEIGVGSEFTISLRFRLGSNPQKVKIIHEMEGLRALVVDDDYNTCVSVTRMLKSIGLRSEFTTSGKEAVLRAGTAKEDNDNFSVYIIDWLMPDMNGVEVVRRIRQEIGNEVPIIILTAYDWSEIEEEAKEAGVTAFCSKPIFLSELYDILQHTGQEKEEDEKEEPRVDFTGKRILLAEDVIMNREIAKTILSEAGFEVDTVENGKIAVEVFKNSAPGYYDLILMDIQMPVMDGYEATKKIRSLDNKELAGIPIIAMTANAFEEDRKQALESGMNGHMVKPIRVNELYSTLEKFL